jgi:hypothetical protein
MQTTIVMAHRLTTINWTGHQAEAAGGAGGAGAGESAEHQGRAPSSSRYAITCSRRTSW